MRTKNNRKNARNRARCFARSRRSYCRTSRTGSKWSKSSILCGLSNLWTYRSAPSCQLHSNLCLGVLAEQDAKKIKDIYVHIFLCMFIVYIYIYMCVCVYIISFDSTKAPPKKNIYIFSSDSWDGCVVKLSRFPAICRLRKPTTSFDGRYWVSPPVTKITRQMTSTSLRKMAAACW